MYRQWQEYAAGYDVAVALAGNKVQTREDVAFLRQHAGDDLLTWFGHEPAVRAMEQGRPFGLADLGTQTSAALAAVQGALDTRPRDWVRYARQAAEFHLKNASGWASAATGQDLAGQIDPGFTLDPRGRDCYALPIREPAGERPAPVRYPPGDDSSAGGRRVAALNGPNALPSPRPASRNRDHRPRGVRRDACAGHPPVMPSRGA